MATMGTLEALLLAALGVAVIVGAVLIGVGFFRATDVKSDDDK